MRSLEAWTPDILLLLVKASHKTSPNSRGEKINFTSKWISSRIKWPMSVEIIIPAISGAAGGEESTPAFHKKSGKFTTREVKLGDQYRATC